MASRIIFHRYRRCRFKTTSRLGFLNSTNDGDPSNHVFSIEFEINDNHVGIDMNSLTYLYAYKAGYWL